MEMKYYRGQFCEKCGEDENGVHLGMYNQVQGRYVCGTCGNIAPESEQKLFPQSVTVELKNGKGGMLIVDNSEGAGKYL